MHAALCSALLVRVAQQRTVVVVSRVCRARDSEPWHHADALRAAWVGPAHRVPTIGEEQKPLGHDRILLEKLACPETLAAGGDG